MVLSSILAEIVGILSDESWSHDTVRKNLITARFPRHAMRFLWSRFLGYFYSDARKPGGGKYKMSSIEKVPVGEKTLGVFM